MTDLEYITLYRADWDVFIQRLREVKAELRLSRRTIADADIENTQLHIHIAQLERVREAAQELQDNGSDSYAVDRKYWTAVRLIDSEALDAALAAVEEK